MKSETALGSKELYNKQPASEGTVTYQSPAFRAQTFRTATLSPQGLTKVSVRGRPRASAHTAAAAVSVRGTAGHRGRPPPDPMLPLSPSSPTSWA